MKITTWTKGLRIKLLLLSLIPTSFLVVIVSFSFYSLEKLTNSLEKANLVRGPLITYSGDMLLYSTSISRWTVTSMWRSDDAKDREAALTKVEENLQHFDTAMEAYLKLPRSEKAKEIFSNVDKKWPEIKKGIGELLPLIKSATKENLHTAQERYVAEIRPAINGIISTIQELNTFRQKMMETELKDETERSTFIESMLVGSGVVACLITFFVMILLLRSIFRQLHEVTSDLSKTSRSLTQSSDDLSSSSSEVAASSAENAASIQSTVSSLEEIASMVKTTDVSSQASMGLSQKTQEQAQQSGAKLQELATALLGISESSEKVTSIIQVIDDISFQTNLLALNAAVEAARAGEQGKGFAVVADAVRALAQKSAVSAKEINTLIQESADKTKAGVELGQQCQTLVKGMFESIQQVGVKSQEIANSCREQNIGMEQIAKAMNELDRATQMNNEASEKISQASSNLSSQAGILNEAIEDLKFLMNGERSEESDHHSSMSVVTESATLAA